MFFGCLSGAALWADSASEFLETIRQSMHAQKTPHVGFVGKERCIECHEQEHAQWEGSHHHLAMQLATDDSVLADFNDAQFTDDRGVVSTFFKKGDDFYVRTQDGSGDENDYRIRYVFGFTPLQQYLIEFPDGRLQAFTVVWDTLKKRWYSLHVDESTPPVGAYHWTGIYQNWNHMCAECHSTDLQKRYNPVSQSYETSYAEINVSCESCHGPGAGHVAWADARKGKANQEDGTNKGLLFSYKNLTPQQQVDSCAPCHSRRHAVSVDDRHGRPFLNHFMPATLSEPLYYPDGQILDEVYVYGSFLQSKMYQHGVSCLDCHNPHTARLKVEGDTLCVQCHNPKPPLERFPTLQAKRYDDKSHHFHELEGAGARCVNCHMTGKHYMVTDYRRDHSFRIPRPDLSLKLNTPNACSQCHTDQSVEWAAQHFKERHGSIHEVHYGEIFFKARNGDASVLDALKTLCLDESQNDIVRATGLELLGRYGAGAENTTIALLKSDEPLLRAVAARVMGQSAFAKQIQYLIPLLSDKIAAVRMEACSVLSIISRESFTEEQLRVLDGALKEYQHVQYEHSDTPAGLFNLALIEQALGKTELTESLYRKAIEFDPVFLPAQVNLARLLHQTQRGDEAERVYREMIGEYPDNGDLHYSLGLLLAGEQRMEDAVEFLSKASELLPRQSRVHYNYGLALQHLNRREEAERILLKAFSVDSKDPNIVYALVVFFLQAGEVEEALSYARALKRLRPDDMQVDRLIQQIESRR